MKLSAQEEYGLRCLIQVARRWPSGVVTIGEISRSEGLSLANTAKLMHLLRRAGFVRSVRGQGGGYRLAKAPGEIRVRDVLVSMGGKLFEEAYCRGKRGRLRVCAHSSDCSIRSLWRHIQQAVDQALQRVTVADLLEGEVRARRILAEFVPLATLSQASAPGGEGARN